MKEKYGLDRRKSRVRGSDPVLFYSGAESKQRIPEPPRLSKQEHVQAKEIHENTPMFY